MEGECGLFIHRIFLLDGGCGVEFGMCLGEERGLTADVVDVGWLSARVRVILITNRHSHRGNRWKQKESNARGQS